MGGEGGLVPPALLARLEERIREDLEESPPTRDSQQLRREVGHLLTKAGGVGLNLTAADTVIHLDPWWNPAVERQATDRAHRIGQDQPVFVYRLVVEGSIEERMLALQERKAALAEGVLGSDADRAVKFGEADLRGLLAPLDVLQSSTV